MNHKVSAAQARSVFITGASSGFGRATALKFATNGWNVVATMRDPEAARSLMELDNVLVTRLDVTDASSIGEALEQGLSRFGRVDVLVNNAGYGQYGIFETIPPEKIQQNYDVNVFGVMNVTRTILPVFREQGRGLILNVSSMGGFFGLPLSSVYISTKFALEGFTESLSYELASQNIVVKLVEPGGGATQFQARAAKQSTGQGEIQTYAPFVKQVDRFFSQLIKGIAAPEHVAEVIYGAITDGTDRLRYMAGDDVKHFVDARRSMSDEAYEKYMRQQVLA